MHFSLVYNCLVWPLGRVYSKRDVIAFISHMYLLYKFKSLKTYPVSQIFLTEAALVFLSMMYYEFSSLKLVVRSSDFAVN